MLLKWIFTFLAFLWLYRALRPYFMVKAPPPPPPPVRPPPPPDNQWVDRQKFEDKDGEYIDYEDLK